MDLALHRQPTKPHYGGKQDNVYLTVRLYNDAKVAEIVHHDYHQRIKPSYGYPNPKMHQKDEKYQLNAFLYDWLVACVERGQSTLNWDVNNGLV